MKTGRGHSPDNESCSRDGGRGAPTGVRPTTFGTDTDAGPVDTTRFTAVPGATEVPDVGFCDITDPAGTVDEDWPLSPFRQRVLLL